MTISYGKLDREEHIRSTPTSPERVAGFYADYLKSRQGCGAIEALFEWANALRRNPDEWDSDHVFGFNVVARKGPFVESSSYAPYRAWQFALAAERYLMSRLEEHLESSAPKALKSPVRDDWESILSIADEMIGQLGPDGQVGLIITGKLREDWLLEFTKQARVTPDWELPSDLNRTWVLGKYQDHLIAHIVESASRRLYAINLQRFGNLIEFGHPRFEIDEITREKAIEMILNREGRTASDEEIVDLASKVWLRLFESWRVDVSDRSSVRWVGLLPESRP